MNMLRYLRGGRFQLTPLYDVLTAWPIIGRGTGQIPYSRARLAMGVNVGHLHARLQDIQPRQWQGLAFAAAEGALPRMVAMAESMDQALADVEATLPERFPAQVWQSISAGCRRHAELFLVGASAPGGQRGKGSDCPAPASFRWLAEVEFESKTRGVAGPARP